MSVSTQTSLILENQIGIPCTLYPLYNFLKVDSVSFISPTNWGKKRRVETVKKKVLIIFNRFYKMSLSLPIGTEQSPLFMEEDRKIKHVNYI